VAATPIGRAADASPALLDALASADIVAAEDTRRLRGLTRALGVAYPSRVVAYFEANEAARTPQLVAELLAGATVLLVSDAGMPAVSDPGYRLVAAAADAGITVRPLPGPSAVLAALAVSGLAVDRFCFEGFLPRRAGERTARLVELAREPRTLVFFEAPHRLAATLVAMATQFGADRRAVVARELTKPHEEVRRATLGELADWAQGEVRGELTLVVAGAPGVPAVAPDPASLAAAVAAAQADGTSRADAMRAVAAQAGVSRRDVFDAVLAAKPG